MTIVSPKYSFVQFDNPAPSSCCESDSNFCIPVINEDDTYFQIIATGADAREAEYIYHLNNYIQLELLNTSGTVLRNWTLDDTLSFIPFRTGLTQVTFLWKNNFKDLSTYVACDQCFKIRVKAEIFGETILAESNCFIRKCKTCYTSRLDYYNEEDYADFKYCNVTNGINRVRLPLYPSAPIPKEDRSIYRKSSGGILQTKSLIQKEYTCLTEYFPEHIHDKLVVALGHDNVLLNSDNYTGGISKSSEYAPEWIDNLCKAQVSFKVLATPFIIRNNNCADCMEITIPPCSAEISGLAATVNGGGQFVLTWTNNSTPDSFAVEYSTDGGTNYDAVTFDLNLAKTKATITAPLSTTTMTVFKVTPYCDPWHGGLPSVCLFVGEGSPGEVMVKNMFSSGTPYIGAFTAGGSNLLSSGINIGDNVNVFVPDITNPHYYGFRVVGAPGDKEVEVVVKRSGSPIYTFQFSALSHITIYTAPTQWTLQAGDVIEVHELI